MKKLFTSAFIALVLSMNVYGQEKTYFDENWEKTTQDKMEYYRESTSKGKLTLIKDFYKNGTLQMEGLASDTTPGNEVFDGKVTWYTPEGKVMSTTTYAKGTQIGPTQSYDVNGKLIEDLVYHGDGTFSGKSFSYKDPENEIFYNSITVYENSNPAQTIIYDDDIKGIRSESVIKNGNYENKYYGEKGKYIGSATSESGKESTQVDYYYNPMRVSKIDKYKSDGTIKESVIYSQTGKIIQEHKVGKKDGYKTTYNESGKKIAHLTYAYDKEGDVFNPMDGEDYHFSYDNINISTIDIYKNGEAIQNKIFDENGKLSSEVFLKEGSTQEIKYYSPEGKLKSTLTYKDDLPYNGIAYDGLSERHFKEGTVVHLKAYSEDSKLKSEKKLNSKQDAYDGTIYNSNGVIVYTFNQPLSAEGDDYNFTGQVVQYVKGKPAGKVSIKEGILQSGKIRLKTADGSKELERSGKWILLKIFNEEGKLVQDSKVLAQTGDDSFSVANQTIILEDDLHNSFD
ncbi:membrane-binding protein [Chryseobacterium indologenes]|uniref:Membrane-binding protein n=2 Tax=Chryseobacterium indologenes TaxID=253 RepID=A0AAD0YZ67_CHRID|nr:hypothetical protein [Chryseobacterium indologenes]AZB20258.1 membrane-binding protein [Chryseobacterium indologenes]